MRFSVRRVEQVAPLAGASPRALVTDALHALVDSEVRDRPARAEPPVDPVTSSRQMSATRRQCGRFGSFVVVCTYVRGKAVPTDNCAAYPRALVVPVAGIAPVPRHPR
jgi:hypothetical protein